MIDLQNSKEEILKFNKRTFYIAVLTLIVTTASFIFYWSSKFTDTFQLNQFLLAFVVGILAQLIDGAIGMAYGVSGSTFLIATGHSPAQASAIVHISEVFTTAASGLSHWKQGNINKKLFKSLLLPGVLGAICGVLLVTSIDGKLLKPFISAYLLIMGLYIIFSAFKTIVKRLELTKSKIFPLAFIGAFVDSIGGGGWGPVVTTTLVATGQNVRQTIGSVNSAEFLITLTSGFTFALLLGVSYWESVAGMVLGGLIIAPFAATLTAKLSHKTLMIVVGLVITLLSLFNIYTVLS